MANVTLTCSIWGISCFCLSKRIRQSVWFKLRFLLKPVLKPSKFHYRSSNRSPDCDTILARAFVSSTRESLYDIRRIEKRQLGDVSWNLSSVKRRRI